MSNGAAVRACTGAVSEGVIVVPAELGVEVLLEAEEVARTESEIRERVGDGQSLAELYIPSSYG